MHAHRRPKPCENRAIYLPCMETYMWTYKGHIKNAYMEHMYSAQATNNCFVWFELCEKNVHLSSVCTFNLKIKGMPSYGNSKMVCTRIDTVFCQ